MWNSPGSVTGHVLGNNFNYPLSQDSSFYVVEVTSLCHLFLLCHSHEICVYMWKQNLIVYGVLFERINWMNAGIYILNDCNIWCKVNMWYFLMIRKYNEGHNEAISHRPSSCLPYINYSWQTKLLSIMTCVKHIS